MIKKSFEFNLCEFMKYPIIKPGTHGYHNGVYGNPVPVTEDDEEIMRFQSERREHEKVIEFKNKWEVKRAYISPTLHINKLFAEGWEIDDVMFFEDHNYRKILVLAHKNEDSSGAEAV